MTSRSPTTKAAKSLGRNGRYILRVARDKKPEVVELDSTEASVNCSPKFPTGRDAFGPGRSRALLLFPNLKILKYEAIV